MTESEAWEKLKAASRAKDFLIQKSRQGPLSPAETEALDMAKKNYRVARDWFAENADRLDRLIGRALHLD